jgi:hypothetical protein
MNSGDEKMPTFLEEEAKAAATADYANDEHNIQIYTMTMRKRPVWLDLTIISTCYSASTCFPS